MLVNIYYKLVPNIRISHQLDFANNVVFHSYRLINQKRKYRYLGCTNPLRLVSLLASPVTCHRCVDDSSRPKLVQKTNSSSTSRPPPLVNPPEGKRKLLTMGSVILPHLHSAWHVDQSILSEDDRLVVIRFGKDGHPDCLRQDDGLAKIAEKIKNFAVIYLCDIDEVPDFNSMYELYDPMTIMVCVPLFQRWRLGANAFTVLL